MGKQHEDESRSKPEDKGDDGHEGRCAKGRDRTIPKDSGTA